MLLERGSRGRLGRGGEAGEGRGGVERIEKVRMPPRRDDLARACWDEGRYEKLSAPEAKLKTGDLARLTRGERGVAIALRGPDQREARRGSGRCNAGWSACQEFPSVRCAGPGSAFSPPAPAIFYLLMRTVRTIIREGAGGALLLPAAAGLIAFISTGPPPADNIKKGAGAQHHFMEGSGCWLLAAGCALVTDRIYQRRNHKLHCHRL